MCKRVKLNSYEPFVRDKNMKFVTHSWYNKTLSFGTPFEFLKTLEFSSDGTVTFAECGHWYRSLKLINILLALSYDLSVYCSRHFYHSLSFAITLDQQPIGAGAHPDLSHSI